MDDDENGGTAGDFETRIVVTPRLEGAGGEVSRPLRWLVELRSAFLEATAAVQEARGRLHDTRAEVTRRRVELADAESRLALEERLYADSLALVRGILRQMERVSVAVPGETAILEDDAASARIISLPPLPDDGA